MEHEEIEGAGYNDEEVEEYEEVEVEEIEEVEVEEGDDEEEHVVDAEVIEQRPVSERQKRKKFEVFVGGLDKDATEEDVRKTFEEVGEVVEVRLMRHPQTGKNKGYAFVRFATVDQAKRAATEFERTKIRGKECGVVPSEDNDTLFVGNISKTWKKEQVLEKLKEYGVEGVEEITLMADSANEELNRGYAFVELATHNDAVKAYMRLSKPDAIFGFDRSAKVAWAEPLIDDEALAKVKSVFVDGVPESWDEPKVKEHFEKFGEIERIVLGKNSFKSKRNDYAFVNYVTREAAVACVEAFKDGELVDGDAKIKVKVSLSKPIPRKKYVQGARGGYPIGSYPFGRGRGFAPRGSFIPRRSRGGRGFLRGGRFGWSAGRRPYEESRYSRPPKRPYVDRQYLDERPRVRPPPRGAAPPRASRGAPRGSYSWREEPVSARRPSYEHSPPRGRGGRWGRGGSYRDDYSSRGGRISTGFTRGGSSRRGRGGPFREDYAAPRADPFPRRPGRGHAYDRNLDGNYGSAVPSDYTDAGQGTKRSYTDVTPSYYDSSRRSYPRARIDYVDPAPSSGTHYMEPTRAPLGRSSVGGRNAVPQPGGALPQAPLTVYDQQGSSALHGSGGHGYSSMMPGANEYSSGAVESRGGTYGSASYGARTASTYGLTGGSSGSYY
ncbi:hypothetical protein KP509_03G033700 [Ceratopteris richardii]|uniref:RRM domain-containing protein n=1 Tax=Ceratopteris richardii TaxID=49495 RepID=A0A8T2UYJ9_CERRI|nr:hypothetical protein KP509_03G033700 [Ceratopteris richardii]